MTFHALLLRFRADLVRRLLNGEFTERELARRSGVSQPHIHHVLSGARTMTPAVADALLDALGLAVEGYSVVNRPQCEWLENRLIR